MTTCVWVSVGHFQSRIENGVYFLPVRLTTCVDLSGQSFTCAPDQSLTGAPDHVCVISVANLLPVHLTTRVRISVATFNRVGNGVLFLTCVCQPLVFYFRQQPGLL